MSRAKLVIRDNSTLRAQYNSLRQGDIVVGRLRLRESEEPLLLDLSVRGVHLVPSGLSQLASRSKTLQTALFAPFMLPLTRAIHAHHDLVAAISDYEKNSIAAVVTKLDRRNAGMGVLFWQSVEEVFTHASLGNIRFPFVRPKTVYREPEISNGKETESDILLKDDSSDDESDFKP